MRWRHWQQWQAVRRRDDEMLVPAGNLKNDSIRRRV
jgi:hypothetical protein